MCTSLFDEEIAERRKKVVELTEERQFNPEDAEKLDGKIRKATSILLKSLKLAPHVAHDRREALAIVRRRAKRLKAILLDAHLGGVDTVRLLNAFRIGAPS